MPIKTCQTTLLFCICARHALQITARLNSVFKYEQHLNCFVLRQKSEVSLFGGCLSHSVCCVLSEQCHYSSNITFSYAHLLNMDCEK